ncbi:MAG: family 16 glycosylhydrolase [Clostridia bacterium]|nr:family 16 glycosylhydrolase [Clostridia bacterium]
MMRFGNAIKRILFVVTTFVVAFCFVACGLFKPQETQKPEKVTVTLSKTSEEMTVGDTFTLTATVSNGAAVEWISGDDEIATVSDDGEVTAVAAGDVKIVASCGTAMASCAVTVKEKPTVEPPTPEVPDKPTVTVSISKKNVSIEEGGSVTLTATASDGSAVDWRSGNAAIATVRGGVVTAVAAGKTNIIAFVDSAYAMCAVTVTEKAVDPIEPTPDIKVPAGYSLVWHDEFDGNALDTSKWNYQTGTKDNYYGNQGPDYWGNSELQYYTDSGNVFVRDGSLEIVAKKERRGDRDYTSGRIVTRDKASWTFGYMEAKMKLPKGNGMWPAFWMLPQPNSHASSNNDYGGWAANGEIDIMEAKGRLQNKVDTTLHFGGYWPQNTYRSHETTLSSDIDEWHTYAVEWTAEYIEWIVDGKSAFKLTNDSWYTVASNEPSAPFDKPFYILFNFAVGGTYDPAGTQAFLEANNFTSAAMYVDYVRVFQKSEKSATDGSLRAVASAVAPQAAILKREETGNR